MAALKIRGELWADADMRRLARQASLFSACMSAGESYLCFCGGQRDNRSFFFKQPLLSPDYIAQYCQWPVQTEKECFS